VINEEKLPEKGEFPDLELVMTSAFILVFCGVFSGGK